MKHISLDYREIKEFITSEEIDEIFSQGEGIIEDILTLESHYTNDLGWFEVEKWGYVGQLESIAREIQEDADVFVLIGVGGSNQASRAVIKAMGCEKNIEILYAGTNLSARYLNQIINTIKGKSLYVNVIAKNFETIEPGVTFRILRQYLENEYGEDAKNRIITTGTKGGRLWQLAKDKGYRFLPFPDDIGGRYTAITPVGLFPMAVAGIDIRQLINGARDMERLIKTTKGSDNIALQYAAIRNGLYRKGYHIEILAYFEPAFEYFSRWWKQLFAESEGKEHQGIFPVACSYSEDLHSVGQYIQEGKRILMETFIEVGNTHESLIIKPELDDADAFGYLDGQDLDNVNRIAYEATLKAHRDGGVPCMVLKVPEISPYYFGQLFYFFSFACYLSGKIQGVNPFNQPGVEAYKINMFNLLRGLQNKEI